VFTVRIESTPGEAHVVECAQYRKQDRTDGVAILSLYQDHGPVTAQTIPTLVLTVDVGRVFVMNAQGNTVDTIRAPQRAHLAKVSR